MYPGQHSRGPGDEGCLEKNKMFYTYTDLKPLKIYIFFLKLEMIVKTYNTIIKGMEFILRLAKSLLLMVQTATLTENIKIRALDISRKARCSGLFCSECNEILF